MRTRKQELVSDDLKPFVCAILKEYREKHQIVDEINWETLTKSEASRIMDKYILVHGR